ncbi:hypothetical protein J4E86_003216 [Alternaria arbusti]|uniref:uncharacterized protein n=1 Tax=Alternaria arbusti TaxID=232088 RepID=UPI0022202EE9|nr:uncharacterized protein J4E86_003216 [Alternaria arbusti]KAI4959494.1 hypothetical protein J4E86_003216 [Alternaria arbusti]
MSYTGSTFPASSATPPVSNTDAVPTSIGTPSSGQSSGNPATPSTPGYVPSGSSAPPNSNTDYVPTSPGAASTGSMSSGYVVPPASSARLSSSITDAVPTSITISSPAGPYPSGPTVSSSYLATPSRPAGSSSSGYLVPSGSSAAPTRSNTDAVPTSLTASYPGASSALPSGSPSVGPSSSNYFAPPGSSIEAAPTYTGGDSTSSTATGSSGTAPGTYSASLSTTPGYPSPSPTTGPGSTVIDSTIRITSYQTQTLISYITAGPSDVPGNDTNTNTNTQAIPTSIPSGVSGGPSGSGYPYPSGGINGTIVAPYPSYIEVPINTGHVVGAGKSSLAAIVVALVFAHFA